MHPQRRIVRRDSLQICTSGVMATLYRGFFFFFFLFDPVSMPHRSYTWQATDLKFIVRKTPTKLAIQPKFQLDWSSFFWDIIPQNPWSELWRFEPGTKSQNLSFWGLGFGLITRIREGLKIWNSQYIERMHPQWRIVRGDSLKFVFLELWALYVGAFSSFFFFFDPFSMPHRSYTWQASDLKFIVPKVPTKLAIQTKFQLDWLSLFLRYTSSNPLVRVFTLWAWNKVSKFEFLGLWFWLDNLNTGSFKNMKFTVHWENISSKAYCEMWLFTICTSGVMATLYRGFFFFFFFVWSLFYAA